ncbi:MAG TPA: nitrate reductase subunit beta, partial [Chloroflexi bacterium]|nr:nitrate reductase subunit beta [Chloroflexota bacterium]
EPWTYDYEHLFSAPEGDDQPTARAVSMITGKPMDTIEAGPNWDDDLGGSPVYAANDPNMAKLTDVQREQLSEVERLVF